MASKFRICPTECISGFRQFLVLIVSNIPVATGPKASVCGHSLAGIMGSNPFGRMHILFLVSVVCCQVEVSTQAGRSSIRVHPSVVCLSVIVKPR